jgi:hypothetical protein
MSEVSNLIDSLHQGLVDRQQPKPKVDKNRGGALPGRTETGREKGNVKKTILGVGVGLVAAGAIAGIPAAAEMLSTPADSGGRSGGGHGAHEHDPHGTSDRKGQEHPVTTKDGEQGSATFPGAIDSRGSILVPHGKDILRNGSR